MRKIIEKIYSNLIIRGKKNMENSNQNPQIFPSFQKVINRFAEKSELLAAEAHSIFNMSKDIHQIIGIIIVHQAAELALKAFCLKQNYTIFKKGSISIRFMEAIKRSKNFLQNEEQEILKILNIKRNAYQHSALFDISDIEFLKFILIDTLSIISKLLEYVGYKPEELNLILSFDNLLEIKTNIKSNIKEV